MALVYIRDPIHGSIDVSIKELKLIDQPAFQRLRNVRQLGFSELAFPGATHSRYAHSLGAMHIATRLFDQLFGPGDLPEAARQQFRQATRLAMLFHDIGHAPLSHATEMAMPKIGKRQATHEDYTLKLILESPLTDKIKELFAETGISPAHIAALIDDKNQKVTRNLCKRRSGDLQVAIGMSASYRKRGNPFDSRTRSGQALKVAATTEVYIHLTTGVLQRSLQRVVVQYHPL
jgi:HD superfamily phosphohydrolase